MPKLPEQARTPGQWLAHSFGWAMSCLGGWLLSISLLLLSMPKATTGYPEALWILALALSITAHCLLWQKAWAGNWVWYPGSGGWLLEVAARFWLVVLTLFQIASFFLLLSAVSLLLGWDTGGDWGSPNTH